MPLAAADRLGPYEILTPLGAGGMGEVFKARDTRLERIVAVKISREQFSERFDREARAVAQLNHPNICTLYDVGPDYLVMEYIEGAQLRGPLPMDRALDFAVQICDALEAAHRKGISHRDLKPDNILVTRQGQIKLLDFGLAKQRPAIAGAEETMTKALTGQGEILGTLHYMSPEQLQGQEADTRSDIFSFGTVLYELLTGRRAFEGESPASVVAAILTGDPRPLSELQPLTPPSLQRTVSKCMAKDPAHRWQSAADLRDELRWIRQDKPQISAPARMVPFWRRALPWAFAAITSAIAVAVYTIYSRDTPVERPVMRLTLLPPQNTTFESMAVAPDGQRLAFTARQSSGTTQLWIRPFNSDVSQALPGTGGAEFPFWSPDSRTIGFFANGKLKRIEVAGGPPQILCDAPIGRGGAWSRDGVIIFASLGRPLHQVAAVGGEPRPATKIPETEQRGRQLWPWFLPDGRHFLYRGGGGPEGRGIYVTSLDSKQTKRLLSDASNSAYIADPQGRGYLLHVRDESLLAAPFDATRFEVTGKAMPVVSPVRLSSIGSIARWEYATSDNGVLVYDSSSGLATTQLVWFDRGGKQLDSVTPPAAHIDFALSLDGHYVATYRGDRSERDLWLIDLSRRSTSRFTFDRFEESSPVWSPDGSRLVFSSTQGGLPNLYQKFAEAGGSGQLLLKSNSPRFPTDWSRDGRFVAYEELDPKTASDIWILPIEKDRKPIPLLRTPSNESRGRFAPDGRWIAYQSDETGTAEVYVQSFDGTDAAAGGKWQISTHGGTLPRWRSDGKELFYLGADGKLMAADVRTSKAGAFESGQPRALFQTRAVGYISYDAAADGERFLINTPVAEPAPVPATVVVNWTDSLRH